MWSVGKAAECVGIVGPFSVVRDLFGYWNGLPGPESLLTQMRLLADKHVHLNLVRTSPLADIGGGRMDEALHRARIIHRQAGLGIGRVLRFEIVNSGFEIISKESKNDLWDRASIDNDGIDVFVAELVEGMESGWSPTPGSCDKGDDESGIALGFVDNDTSEVLGQALAHELGHYLGLDHVKVTPSNLMYWLIPNEAVLTPDQAAIMRDHCFVLNGCGLES